MFRQLYIALIITSILVGYATGQDQEQGQGANATVETQVPLMFAATGYINDTSEVVDDLFRKGTSFRWNIKKGKRYAILVSSNTLDMAIRVSLANLNIYRDLFLGENAGIVFSPDTDDVVEATAFSSLTPSGEDTTLTGYYTFEAFEVNIPPQIIQLPFSTQGEITKEHAIARRRAYEYTVVLQEGTRIYTHMQSTEFDILLELSDRYGRAVVSDDWGINQSLITFVAPAMDDYFITASSFDGTQYGAYKFVAETSPNELIMQEKGTITPTDARLLDQYYKEYSIEMQAGEFRAITLQAFEHDIDFVFADASLQTIYRERVHKDEVTIPVYAEATGTYKLLLLHDANTIVNYSITVYR